MNEKQAQKVFEKYNPAEAVIRCPNGRAPVRKMLDTYARVAMNLYGVISRAELVEIFNRQNTEQTSIAEVFTLLLPIALKRKWYCFYKEYIVHYFLIDDFDEAEYWIRKQGDKPRYIPEKEDFLKFWNQHYECQSQYSFWNKIFDFAREEWPNNNKIYQFFGELKGLPAIRTDVRDAAGILDAFGLVLRNEKRAQTFFNLLAEAHNNTRLWINKGYTPLELHEIMKGLRAKNDPPEIVMQERKKIGLNDPCPCGSGKKYKKCCRLVVESETAQLSRSECTLFYETWYGLLGFINAQRKVIPAIIKPIYPNPIGDAPMYVLREILWENPKWIDDYLRVAILPSEKVELLKSWRAHHKKGTFFVVDYKPDYAVILGSNAQKEDRVFGVKGISRSLADAMQRELPIMLETVLLPFGDKIIYDSYMASKPIGFAEGAKRAFGEMYANALEHGVITSLE